MAYTQDRHLNLGNGGRLYDKVDPLLVALHDSLFEYRVGDTKNYGPLMESVAAILDAKLTESERSLAAEVLIGLIKQAEKDIRRSLSERLAPRKDLHASLLHYLAYDSIDVAEHVLVQSPLLSEMDLVYLIESKAKEHWQAIARREKISETVVMTLVNKKDDKTALNLLKNDSIELAEPVLQKILPIASVSNEVANEFICYKTLPRELAVSVYWHVSVALRESISMMFGVKDSELTSALEDCVQDFSDTMLMADTMRPSYLMREVADMYFSGGKISDKILVDTLRRRQGRFFIALFSKKSGLSYDIIWNMMRQVGGQGLAVACRAMNIAKENFVSLFLLSRTITRSNQAVTADELRMAIRYYDGLTHKMAKEILEDSIAQ